VTDPATRTDGTNPNLAGVLNDEQRATFRSAGFWMAIIGWAEIALGAAAGLVWLLVALGALPREEVGGGGPSEWGISVLQMVGSIIIGILTLIAARSFRRAGRDPAAGLPAVTAAVADLAELYERQVWLAIALLAIAVGTFLVHWW